MPKVVNLRAARKAADRARKRQVADENAARHGRSKAERVQEQARSEKARRHLDGLKFEDD